MLDRRQAGPFDGRHWMGRHDTRAQVSGYGSRLVDRLQVDHDDLIAERDGRQAASQIVRLVAADHECRERESLLGQVVAGTR